MIECWAVVYDVEDKKGRTHSCLWGVFDTPHGAKDHIWDGCLSVEMVLGRHALECPARVIHLILREDGSFGLPEV